MEINRILESNGIYGARILSSCDCTAVPEQWHPILREEDKGLRKDFILDYWKPFHHLLPKTIKIFEQYLADAFLILHDDQVKMAYLFLIDNEHIIYVGNPPKTDNLPTILPGRLLDFYTHIHDGWLEGISGGLGLLPTESIRFLAESEWDSLTKCYSWLICQEPTMFFIMAGVVFFVLTLKRLKSPSHLSGGQPSNRSWTLTSGVS